ncbi:hypothetical protein FF38_02157 [Lucilia cuprina]|uniref:SH2 domain-containing protein n=1 Tax=Lucilia cuprina TaxID=7375 RepID=A0A0L0BZM9_LUCCU|nr:hypothetical protein CVS40_8887 [Lucilia cuprina]KNC25463.1 hypothetical protein FF38_02157 [Lucilia cuprina]
MCWSIRVYWTVLHNLFIRFFSNIVCTCSYSDTTRICCSCCCCGCCKCYKHQQMRNLSEDDGEYDPVENGLNLNSNELHQQQTSRIQHDYVIVDDIDANYLQIEKRKIETEPFYRTIDRATAEDILLGREDGTCLVRPYKETDISIKYIVSIYAQQEFFHLFIRQIKGQELFAIGQEKANEKYFNTPNDIIEFYKHNILQCTNKQCSLNLVLRPIIV